MEPFERKCSWCGLPKSDPQHDLRPKVVAPDAPTTHAFRSMPRVQHLRDAMRYAAKSTEDASTRDYLLAVLKHDQ